MKVLVKLGGTLLDDPQSRQGLATQLAALHKTNPVSAVVHGGGKQICSPKILADNGDRHAGNDCCEAGKHREARAEFNRHLPLIRFELQSGLGVSAMKHHLQAAGIIKYVTVRPPTRSLDAIAVEELRQIVSDLACYGRRKP